MAIVAVNMKTETFDGNNVMQEHNDTVTDTLWTRGAKNGACSYYLPALCASVGFPGFALGYAGLGILYIEDLWGCIPPSNPACAAGYGEKADLMMKTAVRKVSGTSAKIEVFGGTDRTAMSSLGSWTFTASGSQNLTVATAIAVPTYDNSSGKASPYFVHVEFSNISGHFTIDFFDMYYRKYL